MGVAKRRKGVYWNNWNNWNVTRMVQNITGHHGVIPNHLDPVHAGKGREKGRNNSSRA